MHNLSMAHHAAGREDEAIELQKEIAVIGEEMGMTSEEQNEASYAAGGPASGPAGGPTPGSSSVKLHDTREEAKGKNRRKKKTGKEEGDSVTTWKPTNARNSRRKSKKK